jgi:hypothetical protein
MDAIANFTSAPYPGLRPFDVEEHDIFFGREQQTDQLLERLARARFLAIVGPSGCGKSSLVRAGMIAALETGFMAEAGARWRIVTMRPGESPIARLAQGLMEHPIRGASPTEDPDALMFVEASLRRGPLGLVEVVGESGICKDGSLLVLVDQFEELFRFRKTRDADEADAFVAMLLATARQRDLPIYVVLTMRSDFIGACGVFQGLPDAINEGQYLTPRLTREQCALAITGPARVFGGNVDSALVNTLVNDFGPDPDQLPVLQHALMRMWSLAEGPGRQSITLTTRDYQAIGSLQAALSRHANEALGDLSPEQQRIAEVMFRRLSQRGHGVDTRAPARVDEIAEIADTTIDDVRAVADAFRRPDRCFLTPRADERLVAETLLDLGHESLIGRWETLSRWADEEGKSAADYARLKDAAKRWKAGRAALWRTPDLEQALEWRARQRPSAAWARRYSADRDTADRDIVWVTEFIDASKREYEARTRAEEAERRRALVRAQRAAVVSGVVAMLLVAGILAYEYLYAWDYTACFGEFARVRGVPRGLRSLTTEEASHVPLSFRLVRKGRWGPVIRMTAVDSGGRPTPNGVRSYFDRGDDNRAIPNAVEWAYAYNDRNCLISEAAYDAHHASLGTMVYTAPNCPDTPSASVYLAMPAAARGDSGGRDGPTGAKGATPPSGSIRPANVIVTIHYTPESFERLVEYRDVTGHPVRLRDNAFGQERTFDTSGRTTSLTSLDPSGKPMDDSFGNATLVVTYDGAGNEVRAEARDTAGRRTTVKEGWSIRKGTYDTYGNQTSVAYFDDAERPVVHKDGFHSATHKPDAHGNIVEVLYQDTGKNPTHNRQGCYGYHRTFDDRGDPLQETCVGADGHPVMSARGYASYEMAYDDSSLIVATVMRDAAGNECVGKEGYSRVRMKRNDRGAIVEDAFFAPDGSPARKHGYSRLLSTYDDSGYERRREYRAADGSLTNCDDGYAVVLYKHDAFGNEIESRYLDSDENPTLDKEGVAGSRAIYDDRGNKVQNTYLGLAEEHVIGPAGYAGSRSEYDDLGNRTRITYLGLREEAVLSATGIAGWVATYDPRGNIVEQRLLDTAGQAIADRNGYAISRWVYDAHGNDVDGRYFDARGKPALYREDGATSGEDGGQRGHARVVHSYDGYDRLLEVRYQGFRDEPVLGPEGYARAAYRYDDFGNMSEASYFDVANRPMLRKEGYHLERLEHDEYGNVTKHAYYSADDHLVVTAAGYAQKEATYAAPDHGLTEIAYDAENKPAKLEDGCFKHTNVWDAERLVAQECRDADDRPMLGAKGYFAERRSYDRWARHIGSAFVGLKGEPVPSTEGFASAQVALDEHGNLVEQRLFGPSGALVTDHDAYAIVRSRYDRWSRRIEIATFDRNERPMVLGGYWAQRTTFDSLGREARVEYVDTKGPVAPRTLGYASSQVEYGDDGSTSTRYFGAGGEPARAARGGCARFETRVNGRGQVTETACYGADGKLKVGSDRYAKAIRRYDDNGRLIEIASFDANGHLLANVRGYARLTDKYDDEGNVVEEAYFGSDGHPVFLGSGARWTCVYDGHGDCAERTMFDERGKPARPVALIRNKYDERRRLVEERYFDADGKPVRFQWIGQHGTRYEYDDKSNKKTTATFFGIDGAPSPGFLDDGQTLCAKSSARYTPSGERCGAK